MGVSVFVCLLFFNVACGSSIRLGDLPTCSPDNRDCSCSDKGYRECDIPKATTQARAGSLIECKTQCDLANILTGCEWYMFNKDAPGDEACLMFSKDAATMEEFVISCDRTMMPVRKSDGSCTASATNPTSGECSSLICPDGCAPCDETDECNVNYHEAGCSLISPTVTSLATPDLDFCLAVCATTGLSSAVTYADFNQRSNNCDCHETGARRCSSEIAKRDFTEEQIAACQGGSSAWSGRCIIDNPSRVYPHQLPDSHDDNSPTNCIQRCTEEGFAFAGVQDSFQCFCGNSPPAEDLVVDQSECNMGCAGHPDLICGGVWRMNVYG